ncbi:myb domain-contaning protein [Phytophthora sojae]|uniref:Myb domain-contaning protein n=1 Tax=Phytophthora sojae (strain P6497) TaxID=1094619 RepID=G4Z4A7_PHYSP|nr:myb domain-contaning protein [Phytophthora sojae]EGZ19413.1 myb domain-contaning protein [Phytophthora sojae]|eukprot:XP_009522130.1 myb domain-contaning protein [Phytophthora sojae]
MAEQQHLRSQDSKFDVSKKDVTTVSSNKEDKPETSEDYDDLRLSTSSIIELDRKDLLIVKDGTVRLAESLDREQQQLGANGEVVKASGTWTKAEHERFLRAMETFPKGPWKAIAEMVATRTVRQTQTHAQKYREKLARRMRGLRNRNGTLQTPPMAMVQGMVGYPQHAVSPYGNMQTRVYQHPSTMGYTSMPAHVMTPAMTSMAAPPILLARATSLPAMPSSSFHHHHTSYVSAAMPPTLVSTVSSDFSQLSTSTISSAFIGNPTYPSSWEANAAAVEIKPTVPDFDESMDFLMDVYSSNPSQISTSVPAVSSTMTVTRTACIARTPQTPTPSLATKALKRHPGYDVKLFDTSSVN